MAKSNSAFASEWSVESDEADSYEVLRLSEESIGSSMLSTVFRHPWTTYDTTQTLMWWHAAAPRDTRRHQIEKIADPKDSWYPAESDDHVALDGPTLPLTDSSRNLLARVYDQIAAPIPRAPYDQRFAAASEASYSFVRMRSNPIERAAYVAARHDQLAGLQDRLLELLQLVAARAEDAQQMGDKAEQILDATIYTLRSEKRLNQEFRTSILRQPMYTEQQVADLLVDGIVAADAVERMRQESAVLALPVDARYAYPMFQFDLDRRTLHSVASRVNQILGAESDPWGVASWWFSGNARLGGLQPSELLGQHKRGRPHLHLGGAEDVSVLDEPETDLVAIALAMTDEVG